MQYPRPAGNHQGSVLCIAAGIACLVLGPALALQAFDLRVVNTVLQKEGFLDRPLRDLFGLREDEIKTDRAYKLYEDGTAATHLTRDDPPAFLYYGFPNRPITADTPRMVRAHHPVFGPYLKAQMDKVGVECVVRFHEDYQAGDAAAQMSDEQVQFFLKHFPKP